MPMGMHLISHIGLDILPITANDFHCEYVGTLEPYN